MLHNPSQFRQTSDIPRGMNYIVLFLSEPVFQAPTWPEIHAWTLRNGYAVNALGCIWTKMPGVTIQHPRYY